MDPDDDAFDDIPLEEDLRDAPSSSSSLKNTAHQTRAPKAHPFPQAQLEAFAQIDGVAWQDYYKTRIGEAYRDGLKLLRQDDSSSNNWWHLIEAEEGTEEKTQCGGPVLLFEHDVGMADFPRVFRVTGVVKGRAERFLHVIKDHDRYTRLAWDARHVETVQVLEEYHPPEGSIYVVKSEIKAPRPLENRLLLGVQSHRYNAQLQTYTYVFKSAQHYFYSNQLPPSGKSLANAFVCIWIAQSAAEEICQIKMVVGVNVGGNALATRLILGNYHHHLRERFVLWERVVNDWDTYYPPETNQKRIENRK